MREPNFSEGQLQQAANTAFIRRVFEQRRTWLFAHVPSLVAEFDLGWDSAFYLPWTGRSPSPHDEGCNFFVQYKLASQLTSAGAREWATWNAEYFRFKIPHSTKDAAGHFYDDFHQWTRLKALATRGYPVFYATNATLSKADLQAELEAGYLLDHVPVLDVRGVGSIHKHVTFTKTSGVFGLHSKEERAKRLRFSLALSQIAELPQSSLAASTKDVLTSLYELGVDEEGWQRDLTRIGTAPRGRVPQRVRVAAQQAMLQSFVRKHIGADLHWLPHGA